MDEFVLVKSRMTSEPYIAWHRADGNVWHRRILAATLRGQNRAFRRTTLKPMAYKWRMYSIDQFCDWNHGT
jgi:hypothetical protein